MSEGEPPRLTRTEAHRAIDQCAFGMLIVGRHRPVDAIGTVEEPETEFAVETYRFGGGI